jgi:hypothetical protein
LQLPRGTPKEDLHDRPQTCRARWCIVPHDARSLPAQAVGLFRAYLASDGNDANPCTLQLPCRLLPAALAAVADGGEVWLLDSANFNTAQVTVSKSVTILAIPGALGSVVATGGASGLRIDGASVVVSLRNLVLVGLGSSVHGVHFFNGAALHVADCEISAWATAASGSTRPAVTPP